MITDKARKILCQGAADENILFIDSGGETLTLRLFPYVDGNNPERQAEDWLRKARRRCRSEGGGLQTLTIRVKGRSTAVMAVVAGREIIAKGEEGPAGPGPN